METNNEIKFCQSCGMPLTDEILGTNADGSKNEDYCIYCYKDGTFTGNFTMEQMAEYCSMFVEEFNKNTGQNLTTAQYKELLLQHFPNLKRWNGDDANLPHADHPLKKVFIDEVNALGIPGLQIDNLYVQQGSFISQAYNINGNEVKLLDDNAIYWGNQIQKDDYRCYGIACCEQYILVSEYGMDGADAELIILKKRM
ncbi:MAG: zinc ribbon domain-containing protein [Bacteroidaceae bacterium]|nr:zinc ribbon domain-containing protein [Bacteroidaceae bacterium]